MDEDSIAILTLPYSNDLTSVYSQTNNILTLIIVCFEIVLYIALVIFSYLVPKFIRYDEKNKSAFVNRDSVLVYIHLCVWLITLLLRLYLKRFYYKRLRVIGYHKHHKNVSWIAEVPAFVLHKANAILLLILALYCKYESDNEVKIGNDLTLKAELLLQIVISVAVAIILPFLCVQLYHEMKFRRERKPPDVFCIDDPQHLQQAGLSEIGLRSSTYLEDLLEKQADLIGNLKLQNCHLRMLLFKLYQSRGSTNDMTSSSGH